MVKYLRGPCANCRTLITGAEGMDITCPNCKGVTRVPLTAPEPQLEPVPGVALEPLPEPAPAQAEPWAEPPMETEPSLDSFEPVPEESLAPADETPTPTTTPTVAPARPSIVRAALGGLVGALAGAIGWGLIAKGVQTDALGAVAIAIGALCGGLVLAFTLKSESVSYKVIAVLATLGGVFGGKYLVYYVDHKSYAGTVMERIGRAFDPQVIGDFFGEMGKVFGGLDALWILLALAAAWMVPRPYLLGIKTRAKTAPANA